MQHPLTPKQKLAAHLLAAGEELDIVANQLKIRRETLWRWRQKPTFCTEMEGAIQQTHVGLREKLIRLADQSLDAIEEELQQADDLARPHKARNILEMLGMHHFTLPDISAPARPSPSENNNALSLTLHERAEDADQK